MAFRSDSRVSRDFWSATSVSARDFYSPASVSDWRAFAASSPHSAVVAHSVARYPVLGLTASELQLTLKLGHPSMLHLEETGLVG